MRAIEARSEESGVSTDSLMENAGLAVARAARRAVGSIVGAKVVVLIGPGNNGGDGLVTARHLQRWGARVTAYLCRDREADDPKLANAQDAGVRIIRASDDSHLVGLKAALGSAHLVVDAILGTGRARPITRSAGRNPEVPLGRQGGKVGFQAAGRGPFNRAELRYGGGRSRLRRAGRHGGAGIPQTRPHRISRRELHRAAGGRGHRPARRPRRDVRLGLMTNDWARSALPGRPADSHKGTFGKGDDRRGIEELPRGGVPCGSGGGQGRSRTGHDCYT